MTGREEFYLKQVSLNSYLKANLTHVIEKMSQEVFLELWEAKGSSNSVPHHLDTLSQTNKFSFSPPYWPKLSQNFADLFSSQNSETLIQTAATNAHKKPWTRVS